MFKTMKNDLRDFMFEHKSLIYTVLGLFLLDHFFLEGKLKAKLTDLAHRLLAIAEAKVDKIGVPDEQKQ